MLGVNYQKMASTASALGLLFLLAAQEKMCPSLWAVEIAEKTAEKDSRDPTRDEQPDSKQKAPPLSLKDALPAATSARGVGLSGNVNTEILTDEVVHATPNGRPRPPQHTQFGPPALPPAWRMLGTRPRGAAPELHRLDERIPSNVSDPAVATANRPLAPPIV